MSASAPSFEQTLNRLRSTRREWLLLHGMVALVQAAGIVCALGLCLVMIELLFRPSPFVRYVLVYGTAVPGGLLLGFWVLYRALQESSLSCMARRIQSAHPGLGHRLEGALDLYGGTDGDALIRAALQQTAAVAERCEFRSALTVGDWRRRIVLPVAVIMLTAFAFSLSRARMSNALARLLLPEVVEETVGALRIVSVEPGAVELVEGADLRVEATVDRPKAVHDGLLETVAVESGKKDPPETSRRRLSRIDEARYGYTLRNVRASLRYRVNIGGSVTPWQRVSVVPRPVVMRVEGVVSPPAYTGLPRAPLRGTDGSVRALIGSRVELRVTTSHPVVEASLRLSTGLETPLSQAADGRLTASFDVNRSGTYAISLLDGRGHTNENPLARPIEAIPDALPVVRIVEPAANRKVGLGTTVPVRFEALDDYGLREVALTYVRNRHGEKQLLKRWTVPGPNGGKDTPLRFPFDLIVDKPSFDVGDTIALYAEAVDHGEGEANRKAISAAVRIEVIDTAKAAREDLVSLEKVYRRLQKLLDRQVGLHKSTGGLPVTEARCRALAKTLLTEQSSIGATLADVSALLNNVTDPVAKRFRVVLKGLAANEAPDAISGLRAVTEGATAAARRKGVTDALPAQAEIVLRLRQMLAILPQLKEAVEKEKPDESGTDLSPETAAAAQSVKDALEAFKTEQKKVLDATKDLAKTPVDDFTEADEKKLEELRAAEENLRNFLKDVQSDLSKLPKQDFSNPSLLGESMSVLEEVELAENALSMKETEIATTAATTGMELAESMTTHLEKWLSDKADRTAWAMEEPLSDYETPMAELPDKLEDIVGDLIEQEEDLMQEAEDTSSSWADSLDEGAGWDAADGPISNYSAQGVTGNTLPNDTEIGGRSGEGRQGKSHGEMVSDTAVGKGGRKTPSRLTPDSFEAGEINDQSTDASGGATGGGKGGAAGAEGLEGPAPPPDKGPLPRLLGKQAELRNKAERINLNLKLQGYNTSLLENTLAEMRTVEQEMKSGRYQTAARKRHLLVEQLRTARDAIVAEAEVRADRAAGLPRDLQRELLNAVDGGLPEGYEDLVKAYYEKLAE